MLPFLAESKVPSVSSATVHTNLRTTANLGSATKWTRRQTHLVLRQRKANHASTHSNALIVRAITKPTPTSTHSGDIDSTENGTKRNTLRSMTTGSNWFALLRVVSRKYDFEKPQNPFTKCLQEPSHSQHYPQDSVIFWYNSHPRTTLVCHMQSSQHHE